MFSFGPLGMVLLSWLAEAGSSIASPSRHASGACMIAQGADLQDIDKLVELLDDLGGALGRARDDHGDA